MKKEIIGIDVSKATLDAWWHSKQQHKVFSNNQKGFRELLKWTAETTLAELAFCFEHTGLYSLPLSIFLDQHKVCFYLVSGLAVKRSLGLVRGKSDKLDAKNLARFAFLYQHELKPYQMPTANVLRLKQLSSFRAKLVRQRSAHKVYKSEVKKVLAQPESELMMHTSEQIITLLNSKIRLIEREMLSLIHSDEGLDKTYEHICAIKGVGLIVSAYMIVSTNNFQCFDTWRQYACYAGIAPFEHSSGSSFRGKTRVSSLGNRTIKTLLSQAAATAIINNPEMKDYYQRRITEGKSKMSTLNIIRNKLVSRIFAVAKRKTPFVDIHKFAA